MYEDLGPPIEFFAAGGTPEEQKTNLKTVKPSPGFEPASVLCADAIIKDADVTVLDFSAQQVTLRFQIDGLWHSGAPMDRETGDYMLATLKQLAGVDYKERRARQSGKFGTMYLKKKQKFKLVSHPGEGYTTVWRGTLDTCDRLTRDYFVIEHVGKNEPEVINIYPVEYDSAKGEDPMSPIAQLMLKEPDVLAFPEIDSGDLLNRVIDHSVAHQLPTFTRTPGKHCLDALLRLLVLKPDVKKLADRTSAVLTMRLIRLLCDDCKIGFPPHPKMLQQLGLPPGRIAELFRPMVYKPGMVDEDEIEIEPCPTCSGIGYRGRTGMFELLVLNDELKAALVSNPKMDNLAAIAKRHGHVSMQMEGIVMVASGRTSIEELQRVLKS